MKNVILVFALFLTSVLIGQTKEVKTEIKREVKIESWAVSVSVDSAEDLASTFKIEDIKQMLDEAGNNEEVSFEIICNGEKMSNGIKSKLSYKVEGNTNDKERFLKNIEKIRNAAVNYYQNKN